MITNKQSTALVAVAVLVLAVAGPILADMIQAHQAQAQGYRMGYKYGHRYMRHWWHGHWFYGRWCGMRPC